MSIYSWTVVTGPTDEETHSGNSNDYMIIILPYEYIGMPSES